MPRKIRVGILFGGQSSEHEVSLASARSVMSAMDPDKYEVVPIGITKEGAWLTSGDPMALLQMRNAASQAPDASLGVRNSDQSGGSDDDEIAPQSSRAVQVRDIPHSELRIPHSIDVIFPVLHGPHGEDGTVQGLLKLAGIPFVGSDVLGSAVSMDKGIMKEVFKARGLPVAPYLCITYAEWKQNPERVQRKAEEELGYPIFSKPANMGSSVGVSKIHGPDEFSAALDLAARYDRRIMLEQGLDARECECSVLGNDEPEVSVVGEVVPGNEFYDFRAKYIDDNSELIIPAKLPDHVAQEIRRLAIEAFKAVDAAGMARVDFFVNRDLSQIWLNEINTIPGFTRISMYPKLWEASGLPYPKLIDRLIDLAIERHEERKRNRQALDEVGGDLDL